MYLYSCGEVLAVECRLSIPQQAHRHMNTGT